MGALADHVQELRRTMGRPGNKLLICPPHLAEQIEEHLAAEGLLTGVRVWPSKLLEGRDQVLLMDEPTTPCPQCGKSVPEDSLWLLRQKLYCSQECAQRAQGARL